MELRKFDQELQQTANENDWNAPIKFLDQKGSSYHIISMCWDQDEYCIFIMGEIEDE